MKLKDLIPQKIIEIKSIHFDEYQISYWMWLGNNYRINILLLPPRQINCRCSFFEILGDDKNE